MSMQSHLAQLEQHHATLESEIQQALKHPSIDDLELAELKRRKLLLKDEIARLRSQTSLH
jgi:hypothetical protein